MRRLLILGLFCLVLAGGAAVTWQAMGQAKLVEEDLTTARALLTRAGGFESGKLKDRLVLIKQAEAHTLAAGCEAGSAGTTVLHVSEAAEPAAAKLVFGTQPPSDLALWAALFSGVAVLVASIGITARRRREP